MKLSKGAKQVLVNALTVRPVDLLRTLSVSGRTFRWSKLGHVEWMAGISLLPQRHRIRLILR